MLKPQIEQLRALLAEMKNPSANEYRKITTEFNKFKDLHNPNFPVTKLSYAKIFYLVNDCYGDFQRLTKLMDSISVKEYKSTINRVAIGLFYEMVTAIKRNDMFGYVWAGFNLTDAEFNIMEGYRNTVFHIPDDEEKYVARANAFLNWDQIVSRMLENSVALNKYIYYSKKKYSQFIDDEISKWKVKLFTADEELLKQVLHLSPHMDQTDIERIERAIKILENNRK